MPVPWVHTKNVSPRSWEAHLPRPLSRAGVRCGPAQHLRDPDFMDVPISTCVFGPQAREGSAGKWSSDSSVALREVRHITPAHCISRAGRQGAEKQELSIYGGAKGNRTLVSDSDACHTSVRKILQAPDGKEKTATSKGRRNESHWLRSFLLQHQTSEDKKSVSGAPGWLLW